LDLSFSDFDKQAEMTALPADLSVLMVGIAARQANSATARVNARIVGFATAGSLLAPCDGHFNARVAAMLIRWRKE